MGIIKSWSFSAKQNFDACPYKFYHKLVLKTPRPPEPEDSPLKRGKTLHKLAEDFIKSPDLQSVPKELSNMEKEFESLYIDAHSGAGYKVEEPWAFTSEWEPTDWYSNDVWVRMALDLQIGTESTKGRIIDYKTGKKDGNELKHMIQGELYVVGAMLKNPNLQEVKTEFWYLDHNKITTKLWNRKQFEKLKSRWNAIGIAITTTEELNPKPAKYKCRYCEYSSACEFAIKKEDL